MSVARHHADWLSLIEVSGPFMSMPVLLRIFPQGLDARDPEKARELRLAYAQWQEQPEAPGAQRAWLQFVLLQLLEFPEDLITEGQTLPPAAHANLPEYGETLWPDWAIIGPAGTPTAGKPVLLVQSCPSEQKLDAPLAGKHWKASPATRMTELLHAADVELGMVSNGEQWMLVYAPRGETSGYASWYAGLWQEEPITLRAFHSLLHVRRFFGVAEADTLAALLRESANDQHEVTDQLGYQVRHAVEVLVQAIDRIDQDTHRELLKGADPHTLYDAALTVMMRLVFLFSAEERGLLRLGDPLYDANYAISTLREYLREAADQHGEEVLERRFDAWARLLATFRAVHGGVAHDALRLPAYGGTMFDPDRYPFLEGRAAGTGWRTTLAEPLAVNNRVVLRLLESLQLLRLRVAGGGPAEARRLSFRALDIEQIGHVYEGLLDHTAVRASAVVLGLMGVKGKEPKEPEISLTQLETVLTQGEDALVAYLKEQTGRTEKVLRHTLSGPQLADEHALLIACAHDRTVFNRVKPYAGLIRADSFGLPAVILPDSVYVTQGTVRRRTGTHYTPRNLTEPIVRHTLESLVYRGLVEGLPKEQWQLKSPKEILELKVCDPAMGSGAFLVQACRYLSERLVEAWENEEQSHPGAVLISPEGEFSAGAASERLIPKDAAERLAIARRLIADRCLFGVDINPMAVEMAKLSLWLITLQKDRPFTFVDHALKCGDSLLGITTLAQLENFSLNPEYTQAVFGTLNLFRHIDAARDKRKQLEAMASDTPEQIAAKQALYCEAEDAVAKLYCAADVLVALELRGLSARDYDGARAANADTMMAFWERSLAELHGYAQQQLKGRRTLHWPLAYPEIMERGGFDAFLGNPPFSGGQKITGVLGTDYRDYLVAHLADHKTGSADLCSYFFLRAAHLLRDGGMAGLLATNTIAQGDTREVGLDRLIAEGFTIPRAVPSRPWPGTAKLEVAHVWLRRGAWRGSYVLDDQPVAGITAFLTVPSNVQGQPERLAANANKSFQGSNVLGMGFVLTPEAAQALLDRDPRNRACLYPYLNGEDLNSRADQSPSRWVINFHNWPLDRDAAGSWGGAEDDERKAWLRSGSVPADYPNPVAADYPALLKIVIENVKPERDRLATGDATARDRARRWWQFARPTLTLYSTVAGLSRVLTVPLVTHHVSFVFQPVDIVFAHRLAVFPFSNSAVFALLQSSLHEPWARSYSSSLETRINYSPSDCFGTFPFPTSLDNLDVIGEHYYHHRHAITQSRQEGLTTTYNRFHDTNETSVDIAELRRLHGEMDRTVAAAYGWNDLDLGHGFHDTKQGVRYTLSEAARRTVLDRLLALNHQRHAEEAADGLGQKKKTTKKAARKAKNTTLSAAPAQSDLFGAPQPDLFGE